MKKVSQWAAKSMSALAALSLVIATVAGSSTCWFLAYQPEEPEELTK